MSMLGQVGVAVGVLCGAHGAEHQQNCGGFVQKSL